MLIGSQNQCKDHGLRKNLKELAIALHLFYHIQYIVVLSMQLKLLANIIG